MKANAKFVANEEAVSPVIATILMVAITVVLAATVFVLVSDIGGEQTQPPTTAFQASSDNANDNVILQLISGESLANGDWRVSVTSGANSNPEYVCSESTFDAGDQIVLNNETVESSTAGDCAVTGTEFNNTNNGAAAGDAISSGVLGGVYRVIVFHVPSSSTLFDDEVTIA